MAKPARHSAEETFPLKLTIQERRCLFADLEGLEPQTVAILKKTPAGQSFKLTFDQLEDLALHVTDLVRIAPADARELPAGMFRKIGEAMRLAAAQENDEELKRVLIVKKERDARKH